MANLTAATADIAKNSAQLSTISLPPFTPASVAQWIKLCNYAFNAYGINDVDQKCYMLLTALPSNLQCDLTNLMVDEPNVEGKFELLRDNLIKLTDVPESTRIKSLLNQTSMGDRTPSEFLRHLRNVAGTSQDKDSPLLRSLFLDRIPSFMRAIIAHMTDQSLDYLADTADKIHIAIGSGTGVGSELSPTAPPFATPCPRQQQQLRAQQPLPSTEIITSINALQVDIKNNMAQSQAAADSLRDLSKTLNTLTYTFTAAITQQQQQVTTLQIQMSGNSARNNSYRARSTSRPRGNDSSLCYFHKTFGKKAIRCQQPCSWVNESRNNNSGNE